MSELDNKLIEDAFNCSDWDLISNLEDRAESEECKQVLHDRKNQLYHKEEAFANQL